MKTKVLILFLCVLLPLASMAPKVQAYAFDDLVSDTEQGNVNAQMALAFKYFNNDDKQAVYWYTKAAEQGDADAQVGLGNMYGGGEGVPKDYVIAYAWYNLAASQGNNDAQKFTDLLTDGMMTPNQIEEGQKLSRELYKKIYNKPSN